LVYVYSVDKLIGVLNPVSAEFDADAAVALLLRHTNEKFEVLFVKRVESSTDPWSGQIAFPGGKRSPEDQDLKQTVVRETLEETNINLIRRSRFLGAMTALRSTRRPKMKILPFVVLLNQEPLIKLNKTELEDYTWISTGELFQSYGTVEFEFGKFPAYIIGGMVIWGLTYRILKEFERLISESQAEHLRLSGPRPKST
jgi:8-oxo-dGTP pyrophosphatase MutT (NUDIX family)